MRALAPLMPVLLAANLAAAATDLPPVGRSLFDQLTIVEAGGRSVQRVPYPFEALLRSLESRAGPDALGRAGVAAVLIPLGRSLQRNASAQRPFDHPRVVAAVTGEPRRADAHAQPLLKDRLFLGFQDEAGVIEVISYNEAAGRFEFQVVKDYRPGREPQVFYASRTVCTACHHNAGPIFSRPSWDETNANPSVARSLAARAQEFHGVRVARGVDVPNAIDDAVARANRIGLAQLLWRDGCARAVEGTDPASCRAAALAAALKLRLSASGEIDLASERARTELVAPLAAAWRAQWPTGLAEPDPSIPNRDPFLGDSQRVVQTLEIPWSGDEITPRTDPLALRAPLNIWQGDADGIERFIRALASMLATADLDALDRSLTQWPVAAARERFELNCPSAGGAAQRHLRCAAAAGAPSLDAILRFDGGRAAGTLVRLQVGALSLREIALTSAAIEQRGSERRARFQIASPGRAARLADGRALESLELAWTESAGTTTFSVHVALKNAFAPVERALAAMADDTRSGRIDVLADLPFRRATTLRALFSRLGIAGAAVCCETAPPLPAPRVEHEERAQPANVSAALAPFYRHCGPCHAAPDPSPPGFLHGNAQSVERSLMRCAARIAYRLAMWRVAPESRDKVTMPPPSFAASWEHAPPAEDLALMRSHIARLQQSAAAKAQPASAYERLPACRLERLATPRHEPRGNPVTEGGTR